VASCRKSLGVSKLLPFKNDGGHCVLGDLQCCRNDLFGTFHQICATTQSCLGALRTKFERLWLADGVLQLASKESATGEEAGGGPKSIAGGCAPEYSWSGGD
jgi:hypothetical protein